MSKSCLTFGTFQLAVLTAIAVVLTAVAQAQDVTREQASADLEPAVDVSREPVGRDPAQAARAQGPSAAATVPAPTAAQATAQADPGVTRAIDRLDLGTTSITGNQELPKVLYIVPWKRSDLGNLVGRPVNTLLDEVLAPVDPEVFERHLDYYDTLYGEGEQE